MHGPGKMIGKMIRAVFLPHHLQEPAGTSPPWLAHRLSRPASGSVSQAHAIHRPMWVSASGAQGVAPPVTDGSLLAAGSVSQTSLELEKKAYWGGGA